MNPDGRGRCCWTCGAQLPPSGEGDRQELSNASAQPGPAEDEPEPRDPAHPAPRREPSGQGTSLGDDPEIVICAACSSAGEQETLVYGSAGEAPTVIEPAGTGRDRAGQGGANEAPRLANDQRFGPYTISRLLGRGGMGEVYEAEHSETGRRMALKVLRGRLQDADDRARFLREGQLAASVSHPGTVYIFGSEEIAEMPVISMELLPGGTLKDLVDERGPLPPQEAISAVLHMIGGLDAAQAAGILHRDIKPSNCFVDTDGSVKVGDFGLSITTLARDVQASAGPGGFEGTPQFAPPEQLRGEPLDVRADIYAVGATLYYLLTGRAPFEGRTLRELFERVEGERPTPPRALRAEVPAGLSALVVRCLAKSPRERPASYAELAEALRPFLVQETVPASLPKRVAAGFIDALILSIPAGLMSVWRITPAPAGAGTTTTARIDPWTWLFSLAYYLALEGLWGASLGKRLLGLRVSRGDGLAGWVRIAARTGIFLLPNLIFIVPVVIFGRDSVAAALEARPWLGIAGSAATIAFLILLFATIRRSNGWAGIHDLLTGTRVVAPTPSGKFVARRETGQGALPLASPGGGARERRGPFEVIGELATVASVEPPQSRLLLGFDPVLRRRVWIYESPKGTPPVSAVRRDVGRINRLHWLTGKRGDDIDWDAYEAPDGVPFSGTPRRVAGWPVARVWFTELADELQISEREGALPPLHLDRLWIRGDGHIVLLDFPAPGSRRVSAGAAAPATGADSLPDLGPAGPGPGSADPDASTGAERGTLGSERSAPPGQPASAALTPSGLLAALAAECFGRPLAAGANDRAGLESGGGSGGIRIGAATRPVSEEPLPLAAAQLLQRWSRPPLPSLENAHAELAAASASADSVSRIRRAAPILLASLPLLMLLLAALASLPRVSRLTTPEAGVMTGLLIRMLPSEDPDKDLPPSPEMKEAIEIFLAGKFGEKLNDEQIWSLGGTRVQELRNAASGILTRHPHVSPEELASAGAYAKPEIERAHEYYRAKFKPGLEKAGGVILTSLTAIALGFAIVCGLISAWAVPGGILMRLLGLAVVGVDGLEISRARSLARAAVGWLPGIAWILSLGLSPVTRMLASPVATMFGAGVAIIALAAGGAWAIARPSRGPHDHLLHTWVVPR